MRPTQVLRDGHLRTLLVMAMVRHHKCCQKHAQFHAHWWSLESLTRDRLAAQCRCNTDASSYINDARVSALQKVGRLAVRTINLNGREYCCLSSIHGFHMATKLVQLVGPRSVAHIFDVEGCILAHSDLAGNGERMPLETTDCADVNIASISVPATLDLLI